MYVRVSKDVQSFKMYINDTAVDVADIEPESFWKIDYSSIARNGDNTLQISNISPGGLQEAVSVYIPYPVVIEGRPEDVGVRSESLELISDLINTDIENGFTSAQLAVIRNGRLIYENAWGKTNSYNPDGTPCTDSKEVTTDTLPDLETIKQWKSELTIRELLMHQGGFPADPKYCAPKLYKEDLAEGEDYPVNPLFKG